MRAVFEPLRMGASDREDSPLSTDIPEYSTARQLQRLQRDPKA
jgi:hypothetical protein